ncbi:MAG: hypothetical protein HKN21_15740 [Candidatus Eisenbacteria bacterium]|uniref:KaiC-like domain-containing protein n=1 Tax=Eiseniibacteriota bacterium TaxID=2212470 RepID=A0A7Y2EAG1_UNCEI|nr:hypothetical protein [Candidatus Eisenbacteria bacterium]
MIYRKEMNERSPLRVFENSIHGGLGKGNIGVVMARAGVGKTAFLVGVAMDDLMRGQKVLHVSLGDTVAHVAEFYDEIFSDLRRTSHLENAEQARLDMERARMIHSYAGGEFTMERFQESLGFIRNHAHFDPEVIIVDGFDFNEASETEMTTLKDFAQDQGVEIWLSALTRRAEAVTNPKGIPNPVARFDAWVSVMVNLEPSEGAVGVRLLKDHENEDVADLHIKLDPTTMLLLVEE